jgi:lipopolysaccharide biosynthesis protein
MDRRLIAFYLPQYHPIPENDAWWGRGFTEWTNVVKARPLFRGHYQPQLPADLGFYDLRLPEARQAQADLARAYGVHGFCYYHYWFHGRRLLERPFDEVLRSGAPDLPFCLCWANEAWTRSWDGRHGQVLVEQRYDEQDDLQHIRWLAEAFRDRRYIRVGDRPLFLVYRAGRLPDPRRTAEIWRAEARRLGIGELYLCRVESIGGESGDPAAIGFDAAVDFQPDWHHLGRPQRRGPLRRALWKAGLLRSAFQLHRVYDYAAVVERMLRRPAPPYRRFPCVAPGWDNTPRRAADAAIFANATPERYERWLAAVIERFQPRDPNEILIFVNAWNEWAEGNHLEPCQRWGRAYLEATRRALVNVGWSLRTQPGPQTPPHKPRV